MQKLFFGDTPTGPDLLLIHASAILAALLLVLLYLQSGAPAALLPLGAIVLLTLDEAGGVVANATRSTSSWYRRQPARLSVAFHAVHAVQPLVMVFALGLPWSLFWFLYLYQLAAGVLLVRLRTHATQKVLAGALLTLGILLVVSVATLPPVLLILGLLYLVKLVFMFPVNHHAEAA